MGKAEDFIDGLKWKNSLMMRKRRDDRLEVIPNLHNAVVLLSDAPEWKGVIGFNDFRQRIEKRKSTIYKAPPGPWSDTDTGESIVWITQQHGAAFGRDVLDFAVLTVAHRNPFNPAQERLRALAQAWDGTERLRYWLEENLSAQADADNRVYLAEIGAAWLKGVAARVLMPGCKRDDVLVLRGPQGWRKSTAAQAIADCIHADAFTDSVDLNNLAEAKIQIRGVIIAELSELAGLARGDIESIKAFTSTKSDHFREKFGRHA
jgi:putative DNA primase/helicase